MISRLFSRGICLIAVTLSAACGGGDGANDHGNGGPGGPSSSGAAAGSSGASGSSSGAAATGLAGVWDVKGTDARGSYHGRAELAPEGTGFRFTRVIQYDGVKIADGRELHWVWQGTAKPTGTGLAVEVALAKRGFVKRVGSLERTSADAPVAARGSFSVEPGGTLTGAWTGDGVAQTESWSSRKDGGGIFAGLSRAVKAAHDPPGASKKNLYDASFTSFRDLPKVKPYVARPEFQGAIHGYVLDTTDFDFLRANPNAVRVIGRVLDSITIAEATMRANAYRSTLDEKARRFQSDMDGRFMDATVGMVVDGGPPSGPFSPSGDSALWTGTYVAAEAWRYLATGDPQALERMKTSLDAVLKLQEITGDWGEFARTLRKAGATPPAPPWHAGTGAFASLEWLEGGNNDMIKGLFYAQLMGWRVLCKTPKPGAESLCARIRTNAKHLADDVRVDRGLNELPAYWLAAVVTGEVGYEVKALGYWQAGKVELQKNPIQYNDGITDWSGINLRFTGTLVQMLLAEEKNLGGDAATLTRQSIDENHAILARQRSAPWHLLHAAYGSGAKSSPFIDDLRWRLREIPHPKLAFDVDHTLEPEFCMSPYPNVPWKNDWLTSDRTNTLVQYPLFELPVDVSYFKQHPAYEGAGGWESPGIDYLHAYWLARKHGVLAATD